jgi:hypothetical protein
MPRSSKRWGLPDTEIDIVLIEDVSKNSLRTSRWNPLR